MWDARPSADAGPEGLGGTPLKGGWGTQPSASWAIGGRGLSEGRLGEVMGGVSGGRRGRAQGRGSGLLGCWWVEPKVVGRARGWSTDPGKGRALAHGDKAEGGGRAEPRGRSLSEVLTGSLDKDRDAGTASGAPSVALLLS